MPGVNAPRGVHVAANGDIYVMDYWNQRVEYGSLGSSGEIAGAQAFGARGDPNQSGAINFAWDFAIDPCTSCATAGDVFVANRESHQIQVFSPSGTPLWIYGSRGTADDQFTFPQGIAFAPNGTLYVDDSGNDRIQEFTVGTGTLDFVPRTGPRAPARALRRVISTCPPGSRCRRTAARCGSPTPSTTGSRACRSPAGTWDAPIHQTTGTGKQTPFIVPWGVAVAPDGSIWVSDTGNNRLVSMTTAGALNWSVTGAQLGVPDNTAGNQTIYPFAVAFGSGDDVYLSDTWNNRVLVLTS